MTAWQPIETAPKDGTEILGWSAPGERWVENYPHGFFEVLSWESVDGVWTDSHGEDQTPTHWMPLPPPPEAA